MPYNILVAKTMESLTSTPFPLEEDPWNQHPQEEYSVFWNTNQTKFPFASIYRTRTTMRIKWAVVSKPFDIMGFRQSSWYILPYNSRHRDFINKRIYSYHGVPVPGELEEIIEYFLNNCRQIPPMCEERFLYCFREHVIRKGCSTYEAAIKTKKFALQYIIPPLVWTDIHCYDLYDNPSNILQPWFDFLWERNLPPHTSFSACVDLCRPFATQILPHL